MKRGFWKWIRKQRLVRFSAVGLISTFVHASLLVFFLEIFKFSSSKANLIGFSIAFVVSMAGQQRFTFGDRLKGNHLNAIGLLILLLVNSAAAFGFGMLAKGGLVIVLPLISTVINYILLYLFSGNPRFKY